MLKIDFKKNKHMKIKVCGMRDTQNIQELALLNPDYMGFIFYPKSARYVVGKLDITIIKQISKNIQKVGVFVNATFSEIQQYVLDYQLDVLQLHGHETPTECEALKSLNLPIIKAFSVDESFDFDQLIPYEKVCDFFLFDTKGKEYGGNGFTFDWNILKKYNQSKPFFLSGGLDAQNILQVKELATLNIYGIDVNSKFEIEPAYKNISLLKNSVFKHFR